MPGGEGLPDTDQYRVKLEGPPKSNLDIYRKDSGEIISRKKYGADGKAVKDMDFTHYGLKDKHVHDYNNNVRQKRRNPNKKESNEMSKAEKKRRYYNEGKK